MDFINLQTKDVNLHISILFLESLRRNHKHHVQFLDVIMKNDISLSEVEERFVKFIKRRFASEHGKDNPMAETYILEWADRFIIGTAFSYGDLETREILKKLKLKPIFIKD